MDWEFTAYPHLMRRQAVIWTILLGGGAVFGWFMLPANVRDLFTGPQIATLALFVAFMLGIVWVVALGYVKAGPRGVQFRNGLRTHRLGWEDIESVQYRDASHWPTLELTDGSDRMLLGIQRSDGPLAKEQVAGLQAVAARYLDS